MKAGVDFPERGSDAPAEKATPGPALEGEKAFSNKLPEGGAGHLRPWLLCTLFLICALLIQTIGHGKPVPLPRPLSDFPRSVGPWRGEVDEVLPENIVQVLGVDDYVSRSYVGPEAPVHFYASYFATTWGGKSYHSPRNCMPGSGWDVARLEVVPLTFTNPHPHTVEVSRMLMQKGAEHQVVLYWYQGRGRIMPTEYSERIFRVIDSLFHQRTDGAFVRIIVPVHDNRMDKAMDTAVDFAQHIIPIMHKYLPK
ncbi:MAG: exosortase C-terminal domain/associated protein EpsI [Desulfosoma sp.]